MLLRTSAQIAPGPPGHFLLGHLAEFRRDVLGLLLSASHQYGDVVRFRLGPQVIHLVNDPPAIEHVLQRHSGNYDRSTRSARSIRVVCGESLLTSNGPLWQKQRRLLQPSFHHQSVQRFARMMVEQGLALCARWEAFAANGQALNIASEMIRLTYAIAGQALFSAEGGPDADAIEQAMQVILPYTFGRVQNVLNAPRWLPTRKNRRFRAALRALDDVVYKLIEQHQSSRRTESAGLDLLGMLLTAREDGTGTGLTQRQVRDHTITFLLAGHETTSNALTWTLYLLAKYPDAQDRLRREIRAVLGDEAPGLEALPKLPLVRQVIQEALRLYPPIWIIERRVIADDTVNGFLLPAGSTVVASPYALHRHPRFWERPDEFWPERFRDGEPAAYMPFGIGPHSCIGSDFALLEAQLITIMVVQAYRLELVPGHVVEPWPGITLRTREGVKMTLSKY